MLKAKKIAQDELNASLAEQASVLETDTLELRKLETAVANGATYEEAFASSIKNASTAAKEHAIQTKGASGSTDVFVSKQRSAQASLRATATASKTASVAMRALSMAMNMIVIGLITKGLELLGSAISNYIHRVEKANEKIEESRSSYEDAKSSIESMNDELKTTQDKIDNLQSKGTLSFTDKAELDNLKAQNDELERSISLEEKKKQNAASQTVNDIKQNKDTLSDDFEESIKNLSEYQEEYEHMKQVGIKGISDKTVTPENYEVTMTAMDKNMDLYEKHVLENIEKFEKYKEDIINKYNTDDVSQFSQSDRDLYNSIVSQLQKAYKTIYSDSDYNKFVIEPIFNQDKLKGLQDQLLQYFVNGGSTDTSALEEKFGADIITALRNACEKAGIDFDKMIEDMYSNSQSKLDQIAPMIETPNGAEDAKQNQVSKKIRYYIQNDLSEEDRTILLNAEIPDNVKFKTKQDVDNFIDSLNKEADTSKETISFKDAWSGLEKGKDELVKLAEAGRLTANDLKGLEGGKTLMEKTGLSAEQLAEKINKLTDSATQLSSMSAQISKMSDMLADKKNGTIASASDLAGFDVSVRGLESWDEFERVMGDSTSTMNQCQKAANALATEWVNDGNFLANLTDENKQYYITQLEDMGVKNAEQIVTEALIKKEEELRFEKLLSADASTDLQNATVADILKLQNLGDITEKEKAKLAAFTLEKQYCNKNTIVTDADCQNIYTLAKMAGAGTEALNKLASLKQRLSDNPIMSNEMRNNINNAVQDIVNDVTTSVGAKLDIPQVKVNSSGSSSHKSSSKSPSSKKSKSKSQTKSDAAEVFDFIEIKLNNLTDKASKAKDKIDDLLTFGQKKNQTKKAIEATTTAIKKQEKAYKKYMAYANKAAKTQNSKKTTSSSSSSSSGNAVYDTATDYLGLKYVWGGASLTKGADCSGFTQQIYKKFGVSLPHHAADQAKMGTKITSKKDLQAGDLVFFGSKNNITHVGIYGGDGKFIESPHTGASVRVSKLSSRKDFVSGSHFSGISGSTTTSGRNVKKVKGVSSKTLEHYKKLIREGTLGSDGIASIKNENLKNALKDYQTYYEKAKACKEQVASLTDQLKDLYETLANNPIDSASDKIEKLGTKMDILNAKVGNLTFNPTKKIGTSDIDGLYKQIIKNYNSQLSASKTAYTSATKSYKSNKSSLTKSLKKTKAKNIGLTQKEFNSIKSNLKSNKSISYNLINKIENYSLRKKCIAHNEYILAKNTATDNYNQAKEDHTSNVRQARKDRFNKVQARYDNKAGLIEQRKNAVSNSLSIAEAKGQLIGEAYYTRQANAVKSDMKLKQEEAGKLAKKLSTIKFGSDEWYEAQEALNGVYESIQQDEQELAEFQKSINELKFDRFDELLNKLGDITDETDFLIDMLDSDNFFNSDNGSITNDGITAMGLTAQNYDTYLAEAQKYKDAITDLNEMYNSGKIGLTDYNSKLREYQQGQRDSIKSANEAKKSLVAYVKQGLDAQNDALEEAISKKKELLETDKSLKEWNDKLADSNKNIAKLEKQLAALEGDTSESGRKKIQQIKSDLQDAQKDRSDMLYDHSVSDQEDALDKMLENSKKQAEDYLKDTNKVFSDALTYVNANSSQVASNIEKIAKDTGYDISSYIVSAWKDGGSAVGDYASTLSSNVPNITAQLSLIASSWQSICDAADRAAEASAKYAETTVNGTQSIGSPNDSGTSSGNGSGSSGSNNADKQQELNKLRKKASDITEWISKHSVSATHKKSYYGALNQYLYDKQHGQVLSKDNEVALAKKLGVSVKSDLSGKNDREKITSALKKLIKDASFSTGGVIKDLVKLSGEDGISFLQRGEAVLSKEQTQALLNFKPVIPQIDSIIGNLKNIPIEKVSSQSPTYQIDNRTIVEGVATDQIVKQMEGVAQKQAENVVRKINQATYTKGVRRK